MTEKFAGTEGNKVFFDSNIFIYSVDFNEPEKMVIAKQLLQNVLEDGNGIISTQNLQEYYNAVTRKFKRSKEEAKLDVTDFSKAFPVIHITPSIILKAIDIQLSNTLSFYDSLIISTASDAGCVVCYSEDLNDSQIIDGVKVINPFYHCS